MRNRRWHSRCSFGPRRTIVLDPDFLIDPETDPCSRNRRHWSRRRRRLRLLLRTFASMSSPPNASELSNERTDRPALRSPPDRNERGGGAVDDGASSIPEVVTSKSERATSHSRRRRLRRRRLLIAGWVPAGRDSRTKRFGRTARGALRLCRNTALEKPCLTVAPSRVIDRVASERWEPYLAGPPLSTSQRE